MQGIEKITAKIISDAKLDAKVTDEQTRSQIEELQKKHDAQTKKTINVIKKEASNKAEQYKNRAETMADLAQRRNNLAVKRELIELSFDDAMQKIQNLEDSVYIRFIEKILVNLGESQGEVIVSENDNRISQSVIESAISALAEKNIKSNFTLSSIKGDFNGGFILKNGKIETNCTLDMIVKSAKRQLEKSVADELFAESVDR